MKMYFITPPAKTLADALEAWSWIGLAEKRPILITAFADVFFDSTHGVWFLDTLEGKLRKVCETRSDLERILATVEGKDLYLLSGFVDRAVRESLVLKEDECYDFKIHPIVGGAVDYSNVGKMDFLVSLHLRGQLHDQVRHNEPSPPQGAGYPGKGLRPDVSGRHPSPGQAPENFAVRMKPRTKISKFVLVEDSAAKPWWKLW